MRTAHTTKARNGPARDEIQDIALDRIVLDVGVQPRRGEDDEALRDYLAAMLDGAEFPPVDVFWDRVVDRYILADGFHRVRAARAARFESILAHVHLGTRRDAILHAAGANAEHGLKRSQNDKRMIARRMLDDDEWSLWTDAEIARVTRLSESFVSSIRRSSPDLKGHDVTARVSGDGQIRNGPDRGQAAAIHAMPATPLSKVEISKLYASRLAKHLRRIDPATRTDVAFGFGTVEIVTSGRIYHVLMARDADSIYRSLGRLFVARSVLGDHLGITLVGHFAPELEGLIDVLERLDVRCETPEQVLRRKGDC